MLYKVKVMSLRVNLHEKICRIQLFAWRMACCLKGTDPVYDSLANVALRPEQVAHLNAYITTNNRILQIGPYTSNKF